MGVKPGSKYFPLFEYLRRTDEDSLELAFAVIERILGVTLPKSARQSRAFWSNRSRGALQAAAWMESGFHVEDVDLVREQVVFRRPLLRYVVRREGEDILWDADMIRALRAHLGVNQSGLASILGVRQQTVSEWEIGVYAPTRSRSKHITMVAERAGFSFAGGVQEMRVEPEEGLDRNDETV